MEQKLASGSSSSGNSGVPDQNLEQRLGNLDKKVDSLVQIFTRGMGAAQQQQQQGPPPDEYTKVHSIDIGQSFIQGKPNAPVTIVEFADFQCPFCSKFHSVINDVLKVYPDQVKYVLKNYPLPFHPQAKPAAKAALAAGEQGKYWEMADLLFANFKELSEEKFQELAKNIGLNAGKFNKDYKEKDQEWENRIKTDMELGQKVEVRGTPTFYLNGRKTIARDLAAFQKEIDALLKKQE